MCGPFMFSRRVKGVSWVVLLIVVMLVVSNRVVSGYVGELPAIHRAGLLLAGHSLCE